MLEANKRFYNDFGIGLMLACYYIDNNKVENAELKNRILNNKDFIWYFKNIYAKF